MFMLICCSKTHHHTIDAVCFTQLYIVSVERVISQNFMTLCSGLVLACMTPLCRVTVKLGFCGFLFIDKSSIDIIIDDNKGLLE